jgi:hypothetical protein
MTSARRAPDNADFVGIKTYFPPWLLRELITMNISTQTSPDPSFCLMPQTVQKHFGVMTGKAVIRVPPTLDCLAVSQARHFSRSGPEPRVAHDLHPGEGRDKKPEFVGRTADRWNGSVQNGMCLDARRGKRGSQGDRDRVFQEALHRVLLRTAIWRPGSFRERKRAARANREGCRRGRNQPTR